MFGEITKLMFDALHVLAYRCCICPPAQLILMYYQFLNFTQSSGLTVDNLMKFCVNALQHHSGQVRTVSEALIIKLYKQHRSVVKSYLPPDDEKTRRNTLYRQLFEAFDQIDGKPSKRDLEVKFTSFGSIIKPL